MWAIFSGDLRRLILFYMWADAQALERRPVLSDFPARLICNSDLDKHVLA